MYRIHKHVKIIRASQLLYKILEKPKTETFLFPFNQNLGKNMKYFDDKNNFCTI